MEKKRGKETGPIDVVKTGHDRNPNVCFWYRIAGVKTDILKTTPQVLLCVVQDV
jgi:hypothetical protein